MTDSQESGQGSGCPSLHVPRPPACPLHSARGKLQRVELVSAAARLSHPSAGGDTQPTLPTMSLPPSDTFSQAIPTCALTLHCSTLTFSHAVPSFGRP